MLRSPLAAQSPDNPNIRIRQPDFSQPNIGKKRNTVPSYVQDGPPPGHVAQMQRIFQVAKANLHRDMFAASSPASSIESRMELDESSPLEIATPRLLRNVERVDSCSREWRYSIAPQVLAEPSLDVREPPPSPTLPTLPQNVLETDIVVAEPISSGFSSPLCNEDAYDNIETVATSNPTADEIEGLETPSTEHGQLVQQSRVFHSELDQSLTQLKVTSDDSDTDGTETPPIVEHLKRRSVGSSMDVGAPQSPGHSIYLSETAEAAAESAKAKRRLLRDTFAIGRGKENVPPNDIAYTATKTMSPQIVCPDPALHYAGSTMLCPDPLLHQDELSSRRGQTSGSMQNEMTFHEQHNILLPPRIIPPGGHRATATGSPMPFTRARSRPATSQSDYHPRLLSPNLKTLNSVHQRPEQPISLTGHFQPG